MKPFTYARDENLESINVIMDKVEKIQKLEQLYQKLCLDDEIANINIRNLERNVIPNLTSKVNTLEGEIQELKKKRIKNDNMVQSLKKLSSELDYKMEEFLNSSKRTQMEAQHKRENMTQSFSSRVDDIALRLKKMEKKKSTLYEESMKLQEELSNCILEFDNQSQALPFQSIEPCSNPTNITTLDNDESTDSHDNTTTADVTTTTTSTTPTNNNVITTIIQYDKDITFEHEINHKEVESMIYEDYYANCQRLEEKEYILQYELSQFVDRFQDLSNGLTYSNKSLSEHQSRVHELEMTLTSLEIQQQKGKQILSEIKRIINIENNNVIKLKSSVEMMRNKVNKYRNLSSIFSNQIETIKQEMKS